MMPEKPRERQNARQDRARGTRRHRGHARRLAGVRRPCVERSGPTPARRAGHAPARNGQARHRDDDPVAERARGAGDPRRQAGDRGGAPGQRCAGRRSAQAAGSLCEFCRAADAGPGSRYGRTDPLRQRPRHGRRAGQRIFANRHAGQRDLLRPAAIPAVLARGRSARRAVLSASAQSAAELEPAIRRPFLAAWAELGVLGGDRGARAAPDRQRVIRRAARA